MSLFIIGITKMPGIFVAVYNATGVLMLSIIGVHELTGLPWIVSIPLGMFVLFGIVVLLAASYKPKG